MESGAVRWRAAGNQTSMNAEYQSIEGAQLWLMEHNIQRAVIIVDCLSAIKAIENVDIKAHKNANGHALTRIHENAKKLPKVKFIWLPSHTLETNNILSKEKTTQLKILEEEYGNDNVSIMKQMNAIADEMAKKGTKMSRDQPYITSESIPYIYRSAGKIIEGSIGRIIREKENEKREQFLKKEILSKTFEGEINDEESYKIFKKKDRVSVKRQNFLSRLQNGSLKSPHNTFSIQVKGDEFQKERHSIMHSDYRCRHHPKEENVIADTNHILLGCYTIRERQLIFMKRLETKIRNVAKNPEANISFWFEPSFNFYAIKENQNSEENEEMEEVENETETGREKEKGPKRKKQKIWKQSKLNQMNEKQQSPDEKARKELKRKREESKDEKKNIKINKKKKLSSLVMGNLGYVNDKLINQVELFAKSKEQKTNFTQMIIEEFIDHLKETYDFFWKEHIENLKRKGVDEVAFQKFMRKKAVT